MKNDEDLKKEEKQKVAQEYLFSSLLTLGFNLSILQKFFQRVATVHKEQRKILLDSITGGYRHRNHYDDYEIKPVGEIGEYYIVRTADLVRQQKKTSYVDRDNAFTRTLLMETLLGCVFWDDTLKEFRHNRKPGNLGSINLKKNNDIRVIIRLCSVQFLLCGRLMEKSHVTDFRKVLVPYWRNALETFRTELHLSGKPAYDHEIYQVDSYLKILETSN